MPPKLASNFYIWETASAIFSFVYYNEVGKSRENEEPKLIILNFDNLGKDFRNKTNAFIALLIRCPTIDPDRSKTKMYSPL